MVIGGGLLGLEAAKALRDLGLKTHVVEFAPRLMAIQVDDGGGRVLRKKIEDLDVGIHTSKSTTAIVDGETCKHRLQFADGALLETDIVVFSAGIRPRDELARASGLTGRARRHRDRQRLPHVRSKHWSSSCRTRCERSAEEGWRCRPARGAPPQRAMIPGPMVCSCFGVGRNTICKAIADRLATAQDGGRKLRAGTNCGSCLPEIRSLLAKVG